MKSAALVDLRTKALELSDSERAELAHDLVASLDGRPDAVSAEAWDAEILALVDESELLGSVRF